MKYRISVDLLEKKAIKRIWEKKKENPTLLQTKLYTKLTDNYTKLKSQDYQSKNWKISKIGKY